MIIIWIILLLVSFYLLSIVCNKFFTNSIEEIGKKLNLSSEAAGATLMALGSSAPELSISIIALFMAGKHADLGAGNIVGSAIFQFLVILGAVALVRESKLNWKPFVRDMFFYTIAVVLLIIFFYDGKIELHEPILFLGVYLTYVFIVINSKKLLGYEDKIVETKDKSQSQQTKRFIKKHSYITFVVSIVLIGLISWILVKSAVQIAVITKIPEVIIAILIVAAGNSIPDFLASVKAAKDKMSDMAVSNAVGSNNFDIMFGLGFPWLLALLIKKETIPVESTNLFNTSLILLGTVIITITILAIQKWKLKKSTGIILLSTYLIYIFVIIGSGLGWWMF